MNQPHKDSLLVPLCYAFGAVGGFLTACRAYWNNGSDGVVALAIFYSFLNAVVFVLQPPVLFWARLIVRCFLGRL